MEEITFESEPGTLTDEKLHALHDLGVTRLSLGIENFDDEILRSNGRAHLSKEIYRAYEFARAAGFQQINIDLIAGMLNETEANWQECVRKAIELGPDCVTIYQMEVPFNTTIYKEMHEQGEIVAPVADWPTKRAWVDYAFAELEQAGYTVTSGYTAIRDPERQPLPVPRVPVAGRRHDGPGRGLVRPFPRHALSERKGLRALCGAPGPRRTAHRPRHGLERRRPADPRVHPAV